MRNWCSVVTMGHNYPPTICGPVAGRIFWMKEPVPGIYPERILSFLRWMTQQLFGSNDQNFDLSSPSIFDESSNLQPSFPLDSSTLPGAVSLSDQENSIAVGGGCSSNGMMSNPISRRGDFDWFWNMFKIPDLEPKTAPDICPADSEDGAVKPQPKKGDDGGSDEPNEDYAICNGIFLVCCIGNPIRDPDEDIDVMESCWNCELLSGFDMACELKTCS